MLSTSSNKSETCIFILQKGRGKVNFRQQQRSLIKLYARTSFNTQARKKEICKIIFWLFQTYSFKLSIDKIRSFFQQTQTKFFWQVYCKLSVAKFVCRLKNDKAQKIETWEQNSKCKKVNIILVRKFHFSNFPQSSTDRQYLRSLV